jgi:hypothetical protein
MSSDFKKVFHCVVICSLSATSALGNVAKDGQGGMTVSPTSVYARSTNDFTFRFRAQKSTYNSGSQATLLISAGWTAPQTNDASSPGYITVVPVLGSSTAYLAGITGAGPSTITVNFSTAQKQGGFDITYSQGISPTIGGLYKFTAQTKQSGGRFRQLRTGSPVVNVNNPADTNTTISVISSLNPSTYGNAVSFTAAVAPADSTLSGTVTFLDGSVEIGSVPLDATGHATISTNRFSVPDAPSWITAQYSGNSTHNGSISPILYQNVDPALATPSGLQALDKVYDGTTDATLDASNVSLVGVLSGDDVSLDLTAAIASFSDANSGTAKVVNMTGLGLTGNDSGNYTNNPMGTLQASISPAVLTVTAVDTNRAFGTPNPVFSASYSGFVAGEDTSVLSGSAAFNTTADITSSVAGSPYVIQVSAGTLTAANYGFIFVPGKLTITPGSGQLQKIVSIVPIPGGTLSLECGGVAGQRYLLQMSPTLLPGTWTTIATNTTDAAGWMNFVDRPGTNQPTRFYRTALP